MMDEVLSLSPAYYTGIMHSMRQTARACASAVYVRLAGVTSIVFDARDTSGFSIALMISIVC